MKKSKPILKTLRDTTSPVTRNPKQADEPSEPKVSLAESLKALAWPSALPRPGEFVDFGDTPLSSAVNGQKPLTESQLAANWANSPIVSSIRPLKEDTSKKVEPSHETEANRIYDSLTPNEATSHIEPTGPTSSPEKAPESYTGSLPPPPPPPMYKMTANGEQICTQSELVAAWDRWYIVAENWWKTFPNYPPPPVHPDAMQDKPYTTEQWFQRVDFWWSYMQTMYFSPSNAHTMPSRQYISYILDRACVDTPAP